MSKPNVRKVEPSEGQAVTTGEAPAEKPKRKGTPDWKLPAAERAAVKIGRLIQRGLATEQKIAGYSKDIADALGNSRKWLETAKTAAEKLPADFKAPAAPRGPKGPAPELALGTMVTLRDKRRETYAGILSQEELAKGVPVKGVHGSMVSVQTAKGLSFLPRAHVKQVEASA